MLIVAPMKKSEKKQFQAEHMENFDKPALTE